MSNKSVQDLRSLFGSAQDDGMSVPAVSILVQNLNGMTIAGAQGTDVDDLAGDEATLYVRLFDMSGSMSSFQDVVIDAGNLQLDALKGSKNGDQILMSTWTFDTRVHLLHTYLPLANVPKLDTSSYSPNGYTALYDGVINVITSAVAYAQSLIDAGIRVRVVIVIVTDGEDNSSSHTIGQCETVITDLFRQEYYTVSFVAFGLHGKDIGAAMGVPAGNKLDKDSTAHDIRAAFGEVSQSVIRTSQTVIGQQSSQNFFS